MSKETAARDERAAQYANTPAGDMAREIDRLRDENEVLHQNYHHMRELRDRLSKDYGTLSRLVLEIEGYALTSAPVLRSIDQARRAIQARAIFGGETNA